MIKKRKDKWKLKLSISVDEETVQKINDLIEKNRFRNKSHVVEESIKAFIP